MVKRIIIIGATSGIGYEVAKIYWKRGYQLGLAGRRVDRLEEFRKQDPEHIRIKQLDVTAEDAADRLDELIRDLGGMDIFLLSSGIGNQNKYLDTSIEQATIQTNVTGFTRM
ncbi:SDR family NAD(P)-dependent oxidoreductase, partial [Parabacteroides sp.]